MKAEEIKEGDIVEIDYVEEYTKEYINEGKALVIWKGFNHQPLVRKLDTKTTIWTCYEHIAKVVGYMDIEGYMDKALEQELCDDCISRKELDRALYEQFHEEDSLNNITEVHLGSVRNFIKNFPPANPQELKKWTRVKDKTGHLVWECTCGWQQRFHTNYCPDCGAKMTESEV